MAYKALYRSYRPNSFGTVIGQEHIIKTLKNALINNKTSHAYVFSGPRGIGKTTIARILAKAINCEELQNGEPCNKCASCRLINNNETPDIIELDAASNNGVDEIRNVLEKVNFLPGVLKNKVYIIDEVHMLSISAFNALLKTLEEPPAHVMFVLATTEPHKIPATILSRCQRFDFKPLTVKEIKTNLKNIAEKEKIAIEEEALNLVAEAAEGGMRDAIGILDQVSAYSTTEITLNDVNNVTGRISNQKLIELMQTINEGNSAKAVEITNELLALGKEATRIVQSLMQLCRDILLYQNTDGEINDKLIYDDMAFKMLCNTINKKKVFCYIDILSDVQNKVKYSLSPKIFLEVGVMKMANTTKEDYETQVIVDGAVVSGSLNSDAEERLSTLETHLNKLKSELVKLNLNEFKEETKAKLEFLEDLSGQSINNNLPTDVDLKPVLEEIENIKQQISTNNNNDSLLEKIEVLENDSENINLRMEALENKQVESAEQEIKSFEENLKYVLSKVEDLSEKVETKQEEKELTLFDFNNNDNSAEITELKEALELLKEEVIKLQSTYVHVEESLNELILSEEKEQVIQKRQNPYEQKVQDIVSTQRKFEDLDEEKDVKQVEEKTEEVSVQENPVVEQITLDEVIEEKEVVTEDEAITVEEQEENKPEEKVELPEEMTRSIDDLFNNPIDFNNPLKEEVEEKIVVEEVVKEKPKKEIKVQPVEMPDEEDEFKQKPAEEKHYELVCDIRRLEAGLRKMANTKDVPLDVLNYVILDLDGMKEDIKTFISDKCSGVLAQDNELEKDANRNIKTFLITISVRDALMASSSNKEVRKLIEEIKNLIKEFRNVKLEQPVEEVKIVVPVKEEQPVEVPVQQEVIEERFEEPAEEEVKVVVPVQEEIEEKVNIYEQVEKTIPVEEQPVEVPVQQEVVEEPSIEEVNVVPVVEEQEENKLEEKVVVPVQEEIEEKVNIYEQVEKTIPVEEQPKNTFPLDKLIIKKEVVEERPKVVETPQYKRATIIETTPKEEKIVKRDVDNPYAIEKIEAIMHDSRSEISREERKIILNNWGRLGDRVGTGLISIARFLMDGNPVVNGNNCIIITYPTAALCNHIMGDKNHFEAKQILKITFGREYEFIALPENIWQDKRNEYRGQYQTGTKYPKLTPINSPELRIIKKSFVDEKNASYNRAVDLFGKNLIKEEE